MSQKIRIDPVAVLGNWARKNIEEMKEKKIHNPIRFSGELASLGPIDAIANLFDKDVINGKVQVNECLTALTIADRLDLSMEYLVLSNKNFHDFFDKRQRENARLVLIECSKKS